MPFILFFVLLFTGLSGAQTWQMPAKQIYVDNSSFTNINYSTNVPASLQTTLSYVDSNWVGSANFFQLESEFDALNTDYTNTVATIDTRLNVGELRTNFNIINLNFSVISQDFRNAYAYLIGGTQVVYSSVTTNFNLNTNIFNGITNIFVEASYGLVPSYTNVFLTDGSTTNGALVPILQHNQDITKNNFIGVNQNTYFTTNLFSIVGSFLGLTNEPYLSNGTYSNFVEWINNFVQMNTNYVDLPLGLSFSFPDLFQPVKTDISIVSNYVGSTANEIYSYVDTRLDSGPIVTNALLANLNFSIISQDFRNAYAYLLGGTQTIYSGFTTNFETVVDVIGTITNVSVNASYSLITASQITNSPNGGDSNAALVPQLQYNQDITKTNFIGVNRNTYLTTNMFSVVGRLLGLTNNVGISVDYNNWITNFVLMNTNYADLPQNLTFNFPNLIQVLETDIGIVSNFIGVVSNSLRSYVDTRLNEGPIVTNAMIANLNFSVISQDFRNSYAYLLGGTVQGYTGFTTSYVSRTETIQNITNTFQEAVYTLTPGSSTTYSSSPSGINPALVPALQYNQGIYKTNFIRVNTNSHFIAKTFLGLASSLGVKAGASGDYLQAYKDLTNSLRDLVRMETGLVTLPTGLTYNFPNLIQPLSTEIGVITTSVGEVEGRVDTYLRPLTSNVTFNINANMTVSEIEALGSYYDIGNGFDIKYKFADGTYSFTNRGINLNKLAVSGAGNILLEGNITTAASVTFSLGNSIMSGLSARGPFNISGSFEITGIKIEGNAGNVYQNGISASFGSSLVLRPPLGFTQIQGSAINVFDNSSVRVPHRSTKKIQITGKPTHYTESAISVGRGSNMELSDPIVAGYIEAIEFFDENYMDYLLSVFTGSSFFGRTLSLEEDLSGQTQVSDIRSIYNSTVVLHTNVNFQSISISTNHSGFVIFELP